MVSRVKTCHEFEDQFRFEVGLKLLAVNSLVRHRL
jgi:hypothetical protein